MTDPNSVVDPILSSARADQLTSASAEFLIGRGFYGLVWLDPQLVVVARKGHLVDFVELGLPVGLAVLPLFGIDEEIQALRQQPHRSIEYLNVALVASDGAGPRLNFYLHWMGDAGKFLLIVARTTSQTELEAEIESQSRRTAMAEAELAAKAEELGRVNAELTEFAYVISHDLRSPMRGMRYQSEDLDAALQEGRTEDAQAAIVGLKSQIARMSGMLTDLLAYARIGRTIEALQPADTRALIETIAGSLPHPPGLVVAVKGEWPRLEIVGAALDLVLRNLLDNAIKHHDRPVGLIEIEAARAPAGIVIELRDDGPGIPLEHQHVVFQPFRRLCDEGEVEGSGIGLALVRKTVEAAAGTIELISDPGCVRGTTFRLFWPGQHLG